MSFADAFQSGLKAFSEKKYDQARDAFKQSLELDPLNATAQLNLGLTYIELGQKGFAVAHLKKALTLDPSLEAAKQGLNFVHDSLSVKEIPHEISAIRQFQDSVIASNTLTVFYVLTAAVLLGAGLNIIRYLKGRSSDRSSNRLFVAILFSVLFVASLFLVGWKFYDLSLVKATITTDKVQARSLPDENSADLFLLFEGLEVLVQQESGGWVQITYPGGPTGWIPKEAIYITSKENP